VYWSSRSPVPAASAEDANVMTAATKAIVILVDMIIFSSCPKQIGIANWDQSKAALISSVCVEWDDGGLSAGHHPMLQRLSHLK
jgi:hypothetical protein